jgi:glutaconyl-CoA/methylmalonyl-CoA decarboxylase subunit gamma
MKLYKIKVNGKTYEVEVEAVTETASAPSTPVAKTPVVSHQSVTSPMQGQILKVLVAKGQAVKRGQVLCVLEAMKLENDIVAPQDGIVTEIKCAVGQKVDASALLFLLG